MDRGFYVEPTVVSLDPTHRLFRDELFAPFTAVAAVDSFDEAIRLANDSVYGLTAGVYSEDQGEVQKFLDTTQAGVLYVNRRAGATTGAWPGVQAFGGWKGSGSTGKSGLSMYYVAQFLREQSHTSSTRAPWGSAAYRASAGRRQGDAGRRRSKAGQEPGSACRRAWSVGMTRDRRSYVVRVMDRRKASA
jgi:delta 1-pyrroline-5-carboxylate dehydrogenase